MPRRLKRQAMSILVSGGVDYIEARSMPDLCPSFSQTERDRTGQLEHGTRYWFDAQFDINYESATEVAYAPVNIIFLLFCCSDFCFSETLRVNEPVLHSGKVHLTGA